MKVCINPGSVFAFASGSLVSQRFNFQTKSQSDKVRIIQPQRAQSTQREVLIDPAYYSILKEHHIEIN